MRNILFYRKKKKSYSKDVWILIKNTFKLYVVFFFWNHKKKLEKRVIEKGKGVYCIWIEDITFFFFFLDRIDIVAVKPSPLGHIPFAIYFISILLPYRKLIRIKLVVVLGFLVPSGSTTCPIKVKFCKIHKDNLILCVTWPSLLLSEFMHQMVARI